MLKINLTYSTSFKFFLDIMIILLLWIILGHDKHIENMKIYQNLYCVNPSRINHLQHIGVAVSQNKSALMYCDV